MVGASAPAEHHAGGCRRVLEGSGENGIVVQTLRVSAVEVRFRVLGFGGSGFVGEGRELYNRVHAASLWAPRESLPGLCVFERSCR